MTTHLRYPSALLTAVSLSALALGCGGQVTELSGPQGNTPEAGTPGDPSDASPTPSPDASAPDAPSEPEQKACLDIHVTPALLGDPARWEADPAISVAGAMERVFASDARLYVLWMAKEKSAPASGASAYRLIISSFEPKTGAHIKSSVLAPLPQGVSESLSYSISTDNGGNYALLINSGGAYNRPAHQRLILGKLDGSSETPFGQLSDDTAEGYFDHLAWDGQAFVLHGLKLNASEPKVQVAMLRVGADGSIKTPPTALLEVPQDIFRPQSRLTVQTQAETGRSLLLRAGTDGSPLVSVHERDGSLVAGMPASGWKPITGLSFPGDIAGFGPHRYLLQYWHGTGISLQSLDEQFSPNNPELRIAADDSQEPTFKYSVYVRSPHDWQGKWQWILLRHKSLDVQSWVPGQQPESVRLFDYATASCPPDAGTCSRDPVLFEFGAQLALQNDSSWVGVWDQQPEVSGQDPHLFYRVLRVSQGCSYPANQLAAQD